jgi:hypothetical protein
MLVLDPGMLDLVRGRFRRGYGFLNDHDPTISLISTR